MDQAYGTIYVYSVGFRCCEAAKLVGQRPLAWFLRRRTGRVCRARETSPTGTLENLVYLPLAGGPGITLIKSQANLKYSDFTLWPSNSVPKVAFLVEGDFALAARQFQHEADHTWHTDPDMDGSRGGSGNWQAPGTAAWAGDVRRAGHKPSSAQAGCRKLHFGFVDAGWQGSTGRQLAQVMASGHRMEGGSRAGFCRIALSRPRARLDRTSLVMTDNPTTRPVTLDCWDGQGSGYSLCWVHTRGGRGRSAITGALHSAGE